MDPKRFDALARVFATTGSRRSALGALLGAGLLGTSLEAEARKGNGKGKNTGRGGGGAKGKGKSNNKDRGKSKGKGKDRKQVRADAIPGNCCKSGNCTPGKGKNLSKCCYDGDDVSGSNFKGANLGSANFTEADASESNFSGANAGKACFVDADLTGATIDGSTNLSGAIFCRTTMPDGSTNDSGCSKGTRCCPTCIELGETCGPDIGGECCGGAICPNDTCVCPPGTGVCPDGTCRECCDNGERSTCAANEICCDFTCETGSCCTNAQCENPTPFCNANNTCAVCTTDGQCGANGSCTCGGNAEEGQCQEDFFQGFEQNTAGWTPDIVRVSSGTSGIPARTGGFYAKAFQGPSDSTKRFTRWGGYTNEFPSGGYTTELGIYLDPPNGPVDAQFSYSSAINTPNCVHRRDFVFSVGKRGGNPSYCVSASNGSPGNPCDPGRGAVVLTVTGWYLFRHVFRDNGGVLAVDLIVENPNGVVVYSSTLSDPSDVIGNTVGGNRYGWIVENDFTFLAIDDSSRER